MAAEWIAIVDVLLAAAMLYYVYTWLVRTRSAAIVVGLLAFVLLYFGASTFQLHLTTRILQGFYAVALLAVIIIFQPELRRILENVGFIGGQARGDATAPPGVRSITEAAFELAAQRIGALIVLRGRGPLARHITGGIPLDAAISPQLLGSLFDPHSPGHDGAILIDGDRITHFASYLPLSQQLDLSPQYGTRHRAALGISERTDCLAIIVSEERGDVTLARDGHLTPQADVATLRAAVEGFLPGGVAADAPGRSWFRRALQQPVAKVGALGVATSLWFLTGAPAEPPLRARVTTPILYENLAENFYIATVGAETAQAEIEGPPDLIAALQQEPPGLIIDLEGLGVGTHVLQATPESFQLPEGVRLLDAEPNSLEVQLESFRMSTVPVSVKVAGQPAEGFRVARAVADPPQVRVLHKEDALPPNVLILTEPVDVEGARRDVDGTAKLVWPTGFRRARDEPDSVTVRIMLEAVTPTPPAANALVPARAGESPGE